MTKFEEGKTYIAHAKCPFEEEKINVTFERREIIQCMEKELCAFFVGQKFPFAIKCDEVGEYVVFDALISVHSKDLATTEAG